MWKIILHRLSMMYFWRTNKNTHVESIDRLYSKSIIILSRPMSLSHLYAARRLIKQHKEEINKFDNLPWMLDQQTKLNTLWNYKFKLWKERN